MKQRRNFFNSQFGAITHIYPFHKKQREKLHEINCSCNIVHTVVSASTSKTLVSDYARLPVTNELPLGN